jgi:hypothetical protein
LENWSNEWPRPLKSNIFRCCSCYPLLAKPITRAELILGKWLGTWTAPVVATLLFYALIFSIVDAYLTTAYWLEGSIRRPDVAEAILREAQLNNPKDYRAINARAKIAFWDRGMTGRRRCFSTPRSSSGRAARTSRIENAD